MITRVKPGGKTLSPKPLYDVLCSAQDKNINIIENIIQRELVWTYACIETFWHDVLECIKLNIEQADTTGYFGKVFDKAYMVAGNIEYSKPDACNQKYLPPMEIGEYKSIVDGSQRNRISLFMLIAILYEITKQNGFDFINTLQLIAGNGRHKLLEIGSSSVSRLDEFYGKIENTAVSDLSKEIEKRSMERLMKAFEKEDKERDYFDVFALYVHYIERDIVGTYDMTDVLQIVLNNVYFYEEEVDIENKFERFVDRNKKGTPMSDESMYPKYIINQFDDADKEYVYNSFKAFERDANSAQKEGHFRQTKSGINSVLWIMIEALKIKLGDASLGNEKISLKNIFASTFDLGNVDYGIEKCFRNGYFFRTPDEAIGYFLECRDIARFLSEESFRRHDNIYEDSYYLRDFSKGDTIWWYFIKPSYLAFSRTKDRRFKFIKKLLYRIYSFYIVHRSCSTNSQNLINLLERISETIVVGIGQSDDDFETRLKGLTLKYIEMSGDFDGLYHELHALSYAIKSHRTAIENIFISMEYDMCEKFSLPTDVFYTIWKRGAGQKSYNLDHWVPESKIALLEERDPEYQGIGNLVLLEEPLNKSKQDRADENSRYYVQSKYVQTLLMDENNRGTFYNKKIDEINGYKYLTRFSDDTINNPSIDDIKKRKDNYINFFISFVRDFLK